MPPKQALEDAIAALSEKLTDILTSWELRHESLAAVLSDLQLQLAARPSPPPPSFPLGHPASIPPRPLPRLPPRLLFLSSNHPNSKCQPSMSEFEHLCNRVVGLPPESILNCFISGLRSDIQHELAVLQPSSISQAVGLAKLVEAKLLDARPIRAVHPHAVPRTPPLLPAPRPGPSLPIRRLSPSEMQDRRARGLCFNCDDKFRPGHVCKSKQFLLLLAEDGSTPPEPPDSVDFLPELPEDSPPPPPRFLSDETPTDSVHFQLSSAAMSGSICPRTLCLRGSIHELELSVSVLIDSGSSHNIIQPRVAEFLGLTLSPLASFPVLVGNGAALQCSGVCHEVPLLLQSHRFVVSLFVIPIYAWGAVAVHLRTVCV
ncbi:UNVERIFIED_CONTAM: hypothetical protein Slati_3584100 [Sesamum latifolium]|uniref:Uncharacterized protein n=1 Tax=Sesamum latifolium TaxID=2727402 RepID=A0AAW2TYY3_9LAMI